MQRSSLNGLIGLLVVAILVVVVYALTFLPGGSTSSNNQNSAQNTTGTTALLSPSATLILQKSKGFQLLVSYTDHGFEPVVAKIKKGDTIRFTNNSSGKLWVTAYGSSFYPKIAGGCGMSALDSCQALSHGEFWEFTFTKAGTWPYQNKLDVGKNGSVTVK